MYKEGQIIEVRLSADNADELNRHYGIDVCCAQIIGYEKPFDWDTVKPGMAFRDGFMNILWYVGPKLDDADLVCITRKIKGQTQGTVWHFEKHLLTRAPEHDIEVPK